MPGRFGTLFLAVALATIAATERLVFGSQPEKGLIARAPYLQCATTQSIYVVWRTEGPTQPVVRYGATPGRLDRQVPSSSIHMRISLGNNVTNIQPSVLELRKPQYARLPKLHSAPAGLVQYEAFVNGLKADTRYYYAVYDGDLRLTPPDAFHSFVTLPVPGKAKPARFWVVGDSGVGREPQNSVHHAMVDRVQQDRKPLDFYIHVGDMAYPKGRDVEFQTRFFDMYETTLRHVVCWPTLGNHEGMTSRGTNGVGPYFDAYIVPTRGEAGGVPSGTEAYYAFDYGRIHFICLDSHDMDRSPVGAMAQWLKADLERAKADWLVAFWHHPPYTKGSHDSDKEKQLKEMRTHLMPMLESGGVDLVLTGHSHIYERSMLMDGAYVTPTTAESVILNDGDGDPYGDGAYRKSAGLRPHEGTVQVVAGHGGAKLGRKGTMPVMKRIILDHGSVLIDIQGDTLTGIMIAKDGQQQDRFAIVKRGTVTPTRLATPRQLPPYTPPKSGTDDGQEEPPEDAIVLIEKNSTWYYLAGIEPASTNWVTPGFDISTWKQGLAAFGYDTDRAHETELKDMHNNYTTVYLRREFQVENADYASELGLMIDYDDAFIAYLNGKEILRKGVGRGRGAGAESIRTHAAGGYRYYPFKDFEKYLRTGKNVLAIEGHNRSKESSDFTLDPYLIMED